MVVSTRMIVALLMERDVAELRLLRDGAFTLATNAQGQGVLTASSLDGQSFSFSLPGTATLSPLQIATFAQMAIEFKTAGLCSPPSRTRAFFV
jgi:hypothetical protein